MRRCIIFIVLVIALSFFLFQPISYAQPGQGGPDRDNNPPGPKGGPGTNWENPPGPVGGPGASPDTGGGSSIPQDAAAMGMMDSQLKEKAIVDKEWERQADTNKDGVVEPFEARQWKEQHRKAPSGREKSAVDTGWECMADINKDGVVDQTEIDQWHKRNKKDKDNNPPGPKGGRGTNWENPPGPKGGPGASPDRHR